MHILGNKDSKIYLYKVQHNKKEYIETWKKELPEGIEYHCRKRISSDKYIFLQNSRPVDEETVCYDESQTKTMELDIQGEIIDSSNHEVFHQQGTRGKKDWQIIVHKCGMGEISTSGVLASALHNLHLDQHRTLKPPSPHRWDSVLSVCRTELMYVTVECCTKTMDIFDEYGREYYALKLYFIAEISIRQ